MKVFQNKFKMCGYVGYSKVYKFDNISICKFFLSLDPIKDDDADMEDCINAEAVVTAGDEERLKILEKGNDVTIEGVLMPEILVDDAGKKHCKTKMIAIRYDLTKDISIFDDPNE